MVKTQQKRKSKCCTMGVKKLAPAERVQRVDRFERQTQCLRIETRRTRNTRSMRSTKREAEAARRQL